MLNFVLNFLFPPVCVICGKINRNWICDKCQNRIKNLEKFKLITEKQNILNVFCYKNKIIEKENFSNNKNKLIYKTHEEIFFDELFYCFEYKGIIRKLLLQYKFFDKSYLSNFFAIQILKNQKIYEKMKFYDIIIPVPMDKIKKKKRGYNQTELITTKIAENGVILESTYVVKKIRETKTQSTLSLKDRKNNIKDAFEINNKNNIKDKNIILFDDICTTGATVNEIARKLKEVGANKILILVIAKD